MCVCVYIYIYIYYISTLTTKKKTKKPGRRIWSRQIVAHLINFFVERHSVAIRL